MEIKEVTQKLCDAYNASRPIYGNNAEIFGNTTPIKADYEKIYKFLVYLRKEKVQVYADVVCFVSDKSYKIANATLTFLANLVPDEHKIAAMTLLLLFSMFSIYSEYKTENNNSSSEFK